MALQPANLHLINSDKGQLALQVGCSFGISPISDGIEIFVPNVDLTGWTGIGQVRETFLSDTADYMAVFTFSAMETVTKTINSLPVTGSRMFMKMTSTEALKLKVPPSVFPTITNQAKQLQQLFDSKQIKIGDNCWVYEVKVVSPTGFDGGVESVIKPCLVQVIDQVTVVT